MKRMGYCREILIGWVIALCFCIPSFAADSGSQPLDLSDRVIQEAIRYANNFGATASMVNPDPCKHLDTDLTGRSVPRNRPHVSTLVFSIGNDLVSLWDKTDHYLTNTNSITVVTDQVPDFFKKLASQGPETVYSVTAAQYIFTPENLESAQPVQGDRPYSGYLFLRVQSSDRKNNYLVITGVDAGVVGPASGAEALQKYIHKLTGSNAPMGWDNQIRNQLGANVFQIHANSNRWNPSIGGKRLDLDLTHHIGITAGNVNTHAQAGSVARIGFNVPDDLAIAYVSPGEIATLGEGNGGRRPKAAGPSDFSGYLVLGADGRVVGRDLFLDGRTPEGRLVTKRDFIYDYKLGLVLGFKGIEFGYTNVVVGPRFKTQASPSQNGSLFLRYNREY